MFFPIRLSGRYPNWSMESLTKDIGPFLSNRYIISGMDLIIEFSSSLDSARSFSARLRAVTLTIAVRHQLRFPAVSCVAILSRRP